MHPFVPKSVSLRVSSNLFQSDLHFVAECVDVGTRMHVFAPPIVKTVVYHGGFPPL